RVVEPDRVAQHQVSVFDAGRGVNFQACDVCVEGFGRIRVVLDATNAAAVGDAHGNGQRDGALGAVAHFGHVADHLLKCRIGEGIELHFDYRAHSADRHAN